MDWLDFPEGTVFQEVDDDTFVIRFPDGAEWTVNTGKATYSIDEALKLAGIKKGK